MAHSRLELNAGIAWSSILESRGLIFACIAALAALGFAVLLTGRDNIFSYKSTRKGANRTANFLHIDGLRWTVAAFIIQAFVSGSAQTVGSSPPTPRPSSATSGSLRPKSPIVGGYTPRHGLKHSAMLPISFQELAGCANPNLGTSNHNWGVGSNPVYTDPRTLRVGTPTYTSNSIFWISRETRPGQSVLISGAFTRAPKSARVAFIPLGTSDWQSLVRASTTVVPTTQQGTTCLSFVVPSNFPFGVYAFEIDDPSAPPILGAANVPSMNWIIGIPSITNPRTALRHRVYDCGAEPGGIIRIFGKNFVSSDKVMLQSSTGVVEALAPYKLDTNSIAAIAPNTLIPGAYRLWVGSFPWSATSSAASRITIYAPPSLSDINATCPALVGNGKTDNTALLQACLDKNAPTTASHHLAYIAIPAGTFVLTSGVTPHSNEILVGTSPTSTKFIGEPQGAPPKAWFKVPQHFALANLSFKAPANPYLLVSSDSTGNPETSGHLFFDNINIQSTSDATNGREQMFLLAGPDIQVYNSFFLSGSNQNFDVNFGDGGIVSGSRIVLNNWTGLGLTDSQNLIFEKNLIYSTNTPGNRFSGGSGLSIGRSNNKFGRSALSQDIYVGYNTFRNMGSKGQQIITNDGDGGSYFGPIASSTATQVTLAHEPDWSWMGTTNPRTASIAIISGTGVGQYSLLKGWRGRTISLTTPWKVLPDPTSTVVISQYELNMTIAHNTITNTLGASIVLGDALEGVLEDNILTNSGDGILISAYGPYGGPAAYGPVINTDVLRNIVASGSGNLITSSVNTNLAGIGIQDMPGCLVSGLLIRNNVVSAKDTIFSTDGLNGISAVLIELNRANWLPTFPIPGFLVQHNTPP